MIGMATGIGKGRIVHLTIEKQMRQKPDSKVLIIVGTKVVLVKQTHDALAKYQTVPNGDTDYIESEDDEEIVDETTSTDENPLDGQKSFLYKTGRFGQTDANVEVATIQTVQSEMAKGRLNPDEYDLVIVDEVHNIGTPKRKAAIQRFDKVFGLTATPYRHSGRMKQPADYGFEVIESLTLPEAQEMRLLPPLLGIQIDTQEVVDEIPTTKTGQIDFKKLEKLLKNSPELRPFIADRIAQIINDEEGNKYKTVIAVNFVWEAQELAELLHAKGIKVGVAINQSAAKQIHTEEIPALKTIERYKLPEEDEKSIQVLISPYVASEGFDAPFTEVLVWASPTDSQLRYTQYTGRLARRAEGKLFGVVVDCLYQTEQYAWSYNMGMWMKGDVRQLENGLLWLGPETDIEGLRDLHAVQTMSKHSDRKSLENLQIEGLEEISESDFPLTQNVLRETFTGSYAGLMKLALDVVEDVTPEQPDFAVSRISGSNIVKAVTDRDLFIQMMQDKGARLKEKSLEQLQETDTPINQPTINAIFIGGYFKLLPIIKNVIEELRAESPELVVKRIGPSGHAITVVTDREMLVKKMLERGTQLRDTTLEDVKETDIIISQKGLTSNFVGHYPHLASLAAQIIEELSSQSPDLIAKRKKGAQVATVVTDKELFIKKMQEQGIELRDTSIEELKATDMPTVGDEVERLFIGGQGKLSPISEAIVAEIQSESPELIVRRRNGSHIITVVTDRPLFTKKMIEKGVRLKAIEADELRDTDFGITNSALRATFKGEMRKLLSISRTVINKIQSESPELVELRKNGTQTITAITDRELFMQRMQEKGAKLKEESLEDLKDTDIIISSSNLPGIFVGNQARLWPIGQQVLAEIAAEFPNLITKRRNGRQTSIVVTDRELFVAKMQGRGVELEDATIESIKDSDIGITQNVLVSTFTGRYENLSSIAAQVMEELGSQSPDLVARRRKSTRIINAVTDRELFVNKMLEKGVKLKEVKAE